MFFCLGTGTVWKQTVSFFVLLLEKREDNHHVYIRFATGTVRFAAETVLEHINFEIRSKEKIAVVGNRTGAERPPY